jgi:hypothetical protein
MRKTGLWILSLVFSVNTFSADFTLTHLSKYQSGNNRYPGIGENAKGERLAIWRSGNNRGMLYRYFRDGSWSTTSPIPNQPKTTGLYLGSDIVVDSEDRFHVVWELMEDCAFYVTFKDGVWTDPVKIPFPAPYKSFQVSLDIRSNDELVTVATCVYAGWRKDIIIGYLKKGEKNFSDFKNLTDDPESSSDAAVSVDEKDHIWVAYKGEVSGQAEEILETCLFHLDEDNDLVDFTEVSQEQGGWAFLAWVAANRNTSVVMTTWWHSDSFVSRWYNQSTKKWSPIRSIGVTSVRHYDFSMWSKVVAQGNDFYFLAKNSGHILYVVKFNGDTEEWEKPIQVYDQPTNYFDIYPAHGNILIAFCTRDEPSQVYFTSLAGDPEPPKVTVKSAVNVQVNPKLERSFFKGFWINQVTWENNPENLENNLTIEYFNLYRKLKTQATYGTTPYQANIPASQFYFEDKQGIQATPLYDYAVTCVTTVDGEQVESEIEY